MRSGFTTAAATILASCFVGHAAKAENTCEILGLKDQAEDGISELFYWETNSQAWIAVKRGTKFARNGSAKFAHVIHDKKRNEEITVT